MPKKEPRLSRTEIIKANELLKEHLIAEASGLFSYRDDWSDDRIASELRSGMPPMNAIKNLRAELFGQLRKSPAKDAEPRIAALEDAVRNLVLQLAALSDKHTKLCETLSLNQIVNVRHLKNSCANGVESRI
jgi:hypothetical protein